jgi:hypothetical protein
VRAESVARAAALARIGIGAGLTFATVPFLRATVRDEPASGPLVLFARTVGIRDLVFGAACLSALQHGSRRDARRWVGAWLANEIIDVIAAVTGTRHLDRSGAIAAAAAPLPLIAVDLWTLRELSD